jgi:competence protein ComEA
MVGINSFFDFSSSQIKFLLVLTLCVFVMGTYLIIRSYASPAESSEPLPVLLSDGDQQYTGTFIIDPNTSPADSLELLPGIGRVLADRIVAYRQHNRFEQEVDITRVNGIGPHTFEILRPYLKVRK